MYVYIYSFQMPHRLSKSSFKVGSISSKSSFKVGSLSSTVSSISKVSNS